MRIVKLALGSVILLMALSSCQSVGSYPLKNLDADTIDHIELFIIPTPSGEWTYTITDREVIDEIAEAMQAIVIYNPSNIAKDYAGQWVEYTVVKSTGEKTTVVAYNPFLIIDGQEYKTEYEPCEKLNQIANNILREQQ